MDNFRRLTDEESHQRNAITIDFFTSYPRLPPTQSSLAHGAAITAPVPQTPKPERAASVLAAQAQSESRAGATDDQSYDSTDTVDSPNYLEFEGKYWYLILKYRSNALRTAFTADTAEALSLPPSCVRDLRFAQTQLVAHFTIRHSSALSPAQVKSLLDAHAYTRVWKIYKAILHLFDNQFSDNLHNVRPSDLEACVQRVYVGEDDNATEQPSPRSGAGGYSHSGAYSTGNASQVGARHGDGRDRSRDSVVKYPQSQGPRGSLDVSTGTAPSPRFMPVVVATPATATTPQPSTASRSNWLQTVPLEDSVCFDGDYRCVLSARRSAVEAAVSRDIARVAVGAQDVVIRDVHATALKLSVHFAVTCTTDVNPEELHAALQRYPFPETWRLLLDDPVVLNTAPERMASSAVVDVPSSSAARRNSIMQTRPAAPPRASDAFAVASPHMTATPSQSSRGVPNGDLAMTKSAHSITVVGDDWDLVLEKEPLALRAACTQETVAATASLAECVIVVTALEIDTDGALTIQLTAQHPSTIGVGEIDIALAAHPLHAAWQVYDAVHAQANGEAPPAAVTTPVGWTRTAHAAHLDGSAWEPILDESAPAVCSAFVADVSQSLGLPESCITVTRTEFSGFLVVHYTVQCPPHITPTMITRSVDEAPMKRVWALYAQYLKTAGIAAKSTTSTLFGASSSTAPQSRTARDKGAVPTDEVVASRRPSHVEEGRRRSSVTTTLASASSLGGGAHGGVLTTHIIVVDGDHWEPVVRAYPESVKDAVRSDFCRANEADRDAVGQITLHVIPSGLRAAVDFEHPPSISVQLITERLERCEMNALWDLYMDVLMKLQPAPTPRHSRDAGHPSPHATPRNSSARETRVVTQHALVFDEPLLSTRPASVTAALKKDLNPLLEPQGAHVTGANIEQTADGVTILYTVSHLAATPSTDIDRIADDADMQNMWDLADELAAPGTEERSSAASPIAPTPRMPQVSDKADTLPPTSECVAPEPAVPALSPPALHAWEAAAATASLGKQAPASTRHRGDDAQAVSVVDNDDDIPPTCRKSSMTSSKAQRLPRLFAAEEEMASQSGFSRLGSQRTEGTMSDGEHAQSACLVTPLAQSRTMGSRRLSHASLASRRSSTVQANATTATRASSTSGNLSGPHMSLFCVFFEGSSWARVLALYSHDLTDSLVSDISEALSISPRDVLNVAGEYADGLVAHYELLCPADQMQEVNACVDACPMTRTWALYERVLAAPVDGRRPSVATSALSRRPSHSAIASSSVLAPPSRRASSAATPENGPEETVTRHAVYFEGLAWEPILAEHENKLRLALVHDVTSAVNQPPSTLVQLDVEYADGLLVEYELCHASALTVADVNHLVDNSAMEHTWRLYNAYMEEACVAPLPLSRVGDEEELPSRVSATSEATTPVRDRAASDVALEASAAKNTHVDAVEMPQPSQRFMESGRNEHPFRGRSGEAVEIRQYHSDESPTPTDMKPIEVLEEEEEEEDAENLDVVEFAMEFDGSLWGDLLDNRAPALMDAFMADIVDALDVVASVIRGVDLFSVDGLTVNYMLKLPDTIEPEQVNERTDAFEFPRTWQLYDAFAGNAAASRASLPSVERDPARDVWTDMVRVFPDPLWQTVVPKYVDDVRRLFTTETAGLLGLRDDQIRAVHTPVEDDGLYVHFGVVLPPGMEAVIACSKVEAFAFPRLMRFYETCVEQERERALPPIPRAPSEHTGSETGDKDAEDDTAHPPTDARDRTAGPPPPLAAETVPCHDRPASPLAADAVAEDTSASVETSVHTVFVEGSWNTIAVHHKDALATAFRKDVMHAVNIPAEQVTQVEPLAFRHGLLVTYVVLHDGTRELSDVDDLMDADPLDNMWDLYRQHDPDAPSSRSPRHGSLALDSPHALHTSMDAGQGVNPLMMAATAIADRYYSMLFEGAEWAQVVELARASVRRSFVEDCVNALRDIRPTSPRALSNVQVIAEIPLREGMLVHYVVDDADPDQREAIDDVVTHYAFPLTWAVFDAYMQELCGSPRNSTWIAARRSRSRATSYASSPSSARAYSIVAYADDPSAAVAAVPPTETVDSVSASAADASVHTRMPSPSMTSPPTHKPQGSDGPSARPASSHHSLTSFRVQRDKRPSYMSSDSFISLHDDEDGDEDAPLPIRSHSEAQSAAPPLVAFDVMAPVQTTLAAPQSHSRHSPGLTAQESMHDYTFPAHSAAASPRVHDTPPGPPTPQAPADEKQHQEQKQSRVSRSPLPTLHASDQEPATRAGDRSNRAPPLHCTEEMPPRPRSAVETSRVPTLPDSQPDDEVTEDDANPAEPPWLYAFDFEVAKPPSAPAAPGIVHHPINWVSSPRGVDDDAAEASPHAAHDDSIIEMPESPQEWRGADAPTNPTALYDQFFQPPSRPTQQRRIVVLDRAVDPSHQLQPQQPDVFAQPDAIPGNNESNVIVVIQRTTLDVDGLLDKLGQLENLVRNRYDNLRDMFEAI